VKVDARRPEAELAAPRDDTLYPEVSYPAKFPSGPWKRGPLAKLIPASV